MLATHCRRRGWSLVELLAVLAIAAVLFGIGVAPLRTLAGAMGTNAAANQLLADIFLARSEAIKRRQRVMLCKSSNGVACSSAGGWEQGWIVFVDANGNGQRETTEALLQQQGPLHTALRVTGNASLARYVAYSSNGATRQVGGGIQAGTITVCRHTTDTVGARLIVVAANGRPRVQAATVDGCA